MGPIAGPYIAQKSRYLPKQTLVHVIDKVFQMLEEAVLLHKEGKLAEAEASFRKVLGLQPSNHEAQHLLGALLVQKHGVKKVNEGIELVKAAIQGSPSSAKYRNSLGVMLMQAKRFPEAVDAFERANEKDPMNVQVLMNLGKALREVKRWIRASEVYKAVTLIEPDNARAHYNRAACCRMAGRQEQALASFRQHLRLVPDHLQTKFWIAAITGDQAAMSMMPPDMIASLFDQYADNFDDHLVNTLGYQTPDLLLRVLLQVAGSQHSKWRRCVDLGCGTGLMGPLLRPRVGWLEGMDLSAGMVDKARAKGCYDLLHVDELVAYLKQASVKLNQDDAVNPHMPTAQSADTPLSELQTPPAAISGISSTQASATGCHDVEKVPYDLLVAADVFVYIGDLQPVMQAAATVSSPGALFVFSVESYEMTVETTANVKGHASSGLLTTNLNGNGTCYASHVIAHCDNDGIGNSNLHSSTADSHSVTPADSQAYRLMTTGRYVHSMRYVRHVADVTGWKLKHIQSEILRYNMGKPVHGHLCVFERMIDTSRPCP